MIPLSVFRWNKHGGRFLVFGLAWVLLAWSLAPTSMGQALCPEEAVHKKVAVILGASSLDATPDLLRAASDLIGEALMARGLEPIDQEQLTRMLPEKEKQLILHGDTVGAVTLRERLGADMLAVGSLAVSARGLRGYETSIKTIRASLTLKILNADTAEVLATSTWSRRKGGVDTFDTVVRLLEKDMDGIVDSLYRQYCTWAAAHPGALARGGRAAMPQHGPESMENRLERRETPQDVPQGEVNIQPPKPAADLNDL